MISFSCPSGMPRPQVLHLDGETMADEMPEDGDPRIGRRERSRLDQLGQQVNDVRDGAADERGLDPDLDVDPGVVLNLGDSGPDHIEERDRLAPVRPVDSPDKMISPSACRRIRVVR